MKRKRVSGSGVTKRPKKKTKTYQGAATRYVARSPGVKAITETKYFDTEIAQTAILPSATTWAGGELDPLVGLCLFFPTQGNAYNQREGRKTYVKKIKLNGWVIVPAQSNQTATDHGSTIRLIMYMDKQTNASQSQAEDLMASGNSTLPSVMFQNPANFGRFRVLKDKTITMSNPTITYDGTNLEQSSIIRHFKMNVKFRQPMVVNYNNTNGGTIADIVDNSFHFIGIVTGSGLAPEIAYKCRTVFCE